ncbi:histidine phosphatase family protein [Demequina sp. NBRC 110057]|uniref:histidine phosphatase family protein n=1 Tax=Demequina sp. NBRC 110057 TaxID=1570346 RepID=UPI000A01F8D6|nr:histidine phosphatase family protein [Demequina sp. NBRC 110057]
MTTLILWRHSRTAYNVEGRLQGGLDIPLGDGGRAQAGEAARAIVDRHGVPARILSSPLARARESAQELAALTEPGLPVEVDDAFTQRSYGIWEGLTWDEIARDWPDELAARRRGEDPAIEGWGTAADVAARVGAGLRSLAGEDAPVVVVSHGSAIMLGILDLIEQPPMSRILGHVPHAAWSVVTQSESGAWHLEHYGMGAP